MHHDASQRGINVAGRRTGAASPTDKVLAHLHRVKRTGSSKWLACCPAHDDKSPSLLLSEKDDGRLLMWCGAGCSADEIVGAIGLHLADLFPPRPAAPGAGHAPERRPFLPQDVFSIARREIGVASMIAADMVQVRQISDADYDRLIEAEGTLERIAEAAYARR